MREQIEACVRDNVLLGIASISLWEIVMAEAKGRLRITGPVDVLLDEIENAPSIQVLPLTANVALDSMRLGPHFPRDPADRLIAATARCHGLRLMTADERIRSSGSVALA